MGQGVEPIISPLLEFGQIRPGLPAWVERKALIAHAALAFPWRAAGVAGRHQHGSQVRRVAPVGWIDRPHAPAPRHRGLLVVDPPVAGTPPSRAKKAGWHPSQANMSFVSDQTIAALRLQDRTMCSATRSWAMPPTMTAGK